MKIGRETTTSIIESMLAEHQLLSMKEIVGKVRALGEDRTVHDAMRNLYQWYAAIGALDIDGVQYFYLTPETDRRVRKMAERKPETRPRRRKPRRKEAA